MASVAKMSLAVPLLIAASACAGSTPPAFHTPPVDTHVDYQLGGPYSPDSGVGTVVRDRNAPIVSGLYNICYLNAFQAQPGAADFWVADGTDLTLRDQQGHRVIDAEWDEALLDTSSSAHRDSIARIVDGWIDGCGQAGFHAVELDNLDSWLRSDGLLSPDDNLSLATSLIAHAHERGLAVAQKNAGDLGTRGRAAGFDFAVAEECQHYSECDAYTDVYGRDVIEIEYDDQPLSDFESACRLRGAQISVVRRDRDLVPKGTDGYLAQWC